MKIKFACPECKGRKEVQCCECGSDIECEACNGSGLDTDIIDVQAFNAACREAFYGEQVEIKGALFKAKQKKKKNRGSWNWIEGLEVIGRTNGEVSIPYAAFRKDIDHSSDPLAWLENKQAIQEPNALSWMDEA